MKISTTTPKAIDELRTLLGTRVGNAATVEDGAQALAEIVHERFEDSVVLARAFITVPFHSLPDPNKGFVRTLAAPASNDLKAGTPVLSLVGTAGEERDWNDRRHSKGHAGIPLISSTFVDGIPMISRLLTELGVPLAWVDSQDPAIITEQLGDAAGVFFVADAGAAVDAQGRKIIAAQDFVGRYGVQSVFGLGTVYDTGQILVVVLFCRDTFDRDTAELFLPLLDWLKSISAPLVSRGVVFANVA